MRAAADLPVLSAAGLLPWRKLAECLCCLRVVLFCWQQASRTQPAQCKQPITLERHGPGALVAFRRTDRLHILAPFPLLACSHGSSVGSLLAACLFTSRGSHIKCSLLSGVPRRLVSKVMSKQADERASEKGDDRTNEKAERYVWRAFRDIAHHVFGLHIAARHTAQCSHAACTIQRAWRRAVAREWGMPSLLDSKDALGAPWLGLEHAYPNSQCRQNDRRLRYIPIIMRLHSVLFLIGWLGSLQSLLYLYRETGHVACSLRSVMSMSKPTA